MTKSDFAGMGLPASIVRSLTEMGFSTPTPIQAKAIPAQLQGRDILGVAQTGSGKTAAFGLPILAGLTGREGRREPKSAGALILAPTRELAVQIDEMIRTYAARGHISTAIVLGGVSRHAQVQKLSRGVDILVATPGRLVDLLDDKKLRLDRTGWFVLDEADRMLDMGFINPVRKIAAAIGSNRQTALFSATMAPEVAKLAESLLKNPVRVEASPQGTTVAVIKQKVIHTPTKQKRAQLNALLNDDALSKVIIFSRTKHGADRVARNLTIDGHTVAAIHGNKTQNARQSALRGFRAGRVRVLVATDIAARGIDVPDITHVINYELPDDPENYVHRIGRTGRNGASGVAITLVDGGERGKLRDVEKAIRQSLPVSGSVPPEGEAAGSRVPRGGGRGAGGAKKFKQTGARPPHESRPVQAGQKGWWAQLDAEVSPTETGKGPKPAKGKKSRWSKRKKDSVRTGKAGVPPLGKGRRAA